MYLYNIKYLSYKYLKILKNWKNKIDFKKIAFHELFKFF